MHDSSEKIAEAAAVLGTVEHELRTLPQTLTAFQALARLKETSGLLRLLHATTPEERPRTRANNRNS